jgi:hypothetical protein
MPEMADAKSRCGVDSELEWYCPACSEAFPDRVTLRYHDNEDHGAASILEAEYARPYEDISLPAVTS